jgi:hypothetical protein
MEMKSLMVHWLDVPASVLSAEIPGTDGVSSSDNPSSLVFVYFFF